MPLGLQIKDEAGYGLTDIDRHGIFFATFRKLVFPDLGLSGAKQGAI